MSSFIRVTFQPENTTVSAEPGDMLLDVAGRAGIYINSLCGGQGVCGKCRLKVVKGSVDFSSKGVGFLDRKEVDAGYVLACQTKLLHDDVEVWIPPESRQEEEQILMADHIVHYTAPEILEERGPSPSIPYFHPLSGKIFLELPEPSLKDNLSDLERIYRELNRKFPDVKWEADFGCLKNLARLLRENHWRVTALAHMFDPHCYHLRALEPGDTSRRSFGVAIDVGTTTIVTQLVDLRTGQVTAVEASHNQQARYGEDVISRMVFACGHGGIDPLKNAVVTTINAMVSSLVAAAGITYSEIIAFVAAGNTTMTHLLLGLEPCTIRLEPYIPTATRFPWVRAADVGLIGHPEAVLHCMPCVSSYVGGDITAGVLACGMNDKLELSALIDIGTNGEIVIGNNEWLVCCSASAGPAFEGGGTKCGMRATKGAIQKVKIHGHKVTYETVGGSKAKGICGSGLIDLMAELAAEGIIDQSGKFIRLDHPHVQVVDGVPEFVVAFPHESETGEAVVMTQDDIGNLMKSKAAVLAAMKILMENLGMGFDALERIYVAGGFGAHLDIEKSIRIGLLPDVPLDRVQFVGNSSLAGARQCLLSTHAFRKAGAIARQMTYFELSVHPGFMNEFIAALFLPHTDMDLFPSVTNYLAARKASAEAAA
ncbi:MAG: ASKHA domain-containing protein [Desulfosoma sp.]|uniref:ASKHA domain-containing protein n=1 Tax=Desulfosoma sp. TaxID=2603217 RepID=UPI004048FB89